MKFRYAEGNGIAPIHVTSIRRDRGGSGAFVLVDQGSACQEIRFSSNAEFLQIFRTLMAENVALSVGGHCAGPADEAALLLSSGELEGLYVQISWSNPERWTVREMSRNYALPWVKVAEPSIIVKTTFLQLCEKLRRLVNQIDSDSA